MLQISKLKEIQLDSMLSVLMKQPEHVVLIDTSWLLHKSWHAKGVGELSIQIDGQQVRTGHLYGTISFVLYFQKKNPSTTFIFCIDGYPEDRHAIFGDYKKGREGAPVHNDYDVLLGLISNIQGAYLTYNPKQEADDAMGAWALTLKKRGIEAFIYCGDNDLWQVVDNEKIKLFRKLEDGKPIFLGDAYLNDKFGFTDTALLPYYRSLVSSDTSDNIKGVPRLHREIAKHVARLWRENGSLSRACTLAIATLPSNSHKRIVAEKVIPMIPQLEINLRLTKLKTDEKYPLYEVKDVDTETANRYQFSSLLNYEFRRRS